MNNLSTVTEIEKELRSAIDELIRTSKVAAAANDQESNAQNRVSDLLYRLRQIGEKKDNG